MNHADKARSRRTPSLRSGSPIAKVSGALLISAALTIACAPAADQTSTTPQREQEGYIEGPAQGEAVVQDEAVIQDYDELLGGITSNLELPDGYDLRLDLMDLSGETVDNVNFILRFRASCTWAHWAINREVDADLNKAAASIRSFTEHPSFAGGRSSGADFLNTLADDLNESDHDGASQFVKANCQGMGLPE